MSYSWLWSCTEVDGAAGIAFHPVHVCYVILHLYLCLSVCVVVCACMCDCVCVYVCVIAPGPVLVAITHRERQ